MLTLTVQPRAELGKAAQKVRKEGFIPAVVYGPTIKPHSVSVRISDFEKTYREAGETTLITLKIEGEDKGDSGVVLIRDPKTNPINRTFTHVDFYQLPLDKPIEISVPVEVEGEAPAAKELGGTLVQNLYEVNVKALPQNLIHGITIDVSGLATFEDAITVADLSVPENVEILAEPETTVAFVEEPREEEEEEPVESEEDAIADIKTEGEEKREEEAEEAADSGESA